MKKILLFILMFLLVGCAKEDKEEIERIEKLINNPPTITPTPYIDNNPIKVGIYKDRKLITEYNYKFKNESDIAIFSIFFTNEENVGNGNFKDTWKKYYNQYEDITEYKIGFEVSFEVDGEKKEALVLGPKNLYDLDPYLYPFLYDDIHNSGYYSHVTTKDVKDDTVYSSIKLYLHHDTSKITSPITLKVFTYKSDDDFTNGHYRGNSEYTITINNK